MEGVNFTRINFVGHSPFADTIFDDEVQHLELIKEVDIMLDTLLVQGLQNHVAGAVSRDSMTTSIASRHIISMASWSPR